MTIHPVEIENNHRRAVAGALVELDAESGVTLYAIAAAAGLKRSFVEDVLFSLDAYGEAEALLPLKDKLWRITDYGRKAYRDERFASKKRTCLCCRNEFDSSHAGNRICEKCIKSEHLGVDSSDASEIT